MSNRSTKKPDVTFLFSDTGEVTGLLRKPSSNPSTSNTALAW